MDSGTAKIDSYQAFLKSKVQLARRDGFDVDGAEINPVLKPHQRAAVKWALAGGRRALFESFGLGKSIQQLEILRLVLKKLGRGRALIVCPLGVRQEFKRDAVEILGWKIPPTFVRKDSEVDGAGIYITNYESLREGKLDPTLFDAISLDEASVLRSFGSKTFGEFLFGDVQKITYRFVATATPSPNEFQELIAYAHFLGVMDIGQARTRFFKRNSEKSDDLTLHKHKEEEFWLWVSSWALFLQTPSDLGFSDEGYKLPEMKVHFHEVAVDHRGAVPDRFGQGQMFRNATAGVSEAAREKRDTLDVRVIQTLDIVVKYLNTTTYEEAFNDATRTESEILRGEPGSGESPMPGLLPQKQRQDRPREEESVHDGVPKDLSKETDIVDQAGRDTASQTRTLSDGSGVSGTSKSPGSSQQPETSSNETPKSTKGRIRSNDRGVQCATRKPRRRMRDLPNEGDGCCGERQEGEVSVDRSRSPKRSGPGDSLSSLQRGPWPVSGRSAIAGEGDPIPQFVIWCDLDAEQRAVEKAFREAGISYSSIFGSQSIEVKEAKLKEWRSRETTALISKPVILGSGVNLQQSHIAVFVGIGYKFNDFIQSVARIHRFLQTHPVEIHIIYAESEKTVLQVLMEKWERDREQRKRMAEIIRQYGLSHEALNSQITRGFGVDREEIKSRKGNWSAINNDSVLETRQMPEKSVGLVLTSIPFSTQYEYSPNYNDFGHTEDNEHFFAQMDFLTPELLRVLEPGRFAAVHVKDRVVPSGMTGLGFQVVYEFHCDVIRHYRKHGFAFMGMKTIVTDVVRENNQTYRLGWTEQCKDGTKMGVGMPEYLLLFRKPPTDTGNSYADNPVIKSKEAYTRGRWQIDAHGFMRVAGDRLLQPEEFKKLRWNVIYKLFRKHSLADVYDYAEHVTLSEALDDHGRLPVDFMLLPPQSWHPDVWTDITRMRTLNSSQSQKGKQMHLCPLQFDIVDRVIEQHSMPGEVVLDPFGGIGTVGYRAVLKGRKAISIELNHQYHRDAAYYMQDAEDKAAVPSLFDLAEVEDQEIEEVVV